MNPARLQQPHETNRLVDAAGAADWLEGQFVPGLVSVVVPTYNRLVLLGEAIESLTRQTWPSIEVIVVDDGSTDGTFAHWEMKLAAWTDARRTFRIVTQENAGVSAARNAGTRAARGEFFVYLDSDDRLHPEAIARYVEALRRHDAAYCIAPIDSVDEAGRLTEDHQRYYPRHQARDYLFDCFWLVHGACYRRAVLNRAGPWNPQLSRAEDHEYFWRVKLTSGRGYYLDAVQGVYRQHSREQIHHQLSHAAFFQNRLRSIELLTDWAQARGLLDRELRIRISRQSRFLATRLMIAGDVHGKNQAVRLIGRLLHGIWHPLRLVALFRFINRSGFYARLAGWRYRWARGRSRIRTKPTAREAVESETKAPELLFVSPISPDPEGTGPARRADAVITALARKYRVTLLIVGRQNAQVRSLPAADFLGGRWHFLPYQPRPAERWLRGWERRFPWLYRKIFRLPVTWCEVTPMRRRAAADVFDGRRFAVVHVFRLIMAPYALTIKKRQPAGTQFVLDIDDVESRCHQRIADLKHRNGELAEAVHFGRVAQDFARVEREMVPQFDRIYACSELDQGFLKSLHRDVRVLPNTVRPPGATWRPNAPGAELRLLFLGLLGYYPNQDAVAWLCREILPAMRREIPCRLWVGGRGMTRELEGMLASTAGVEYFGEFATADDGFSRGDVLVVPLRAGGGTRIKILEAMARGMPVVSTGIGVEGIAAEPGRDYLRADTVEEFVTATARLWRDSALRAQLSHHGHALWAERYSPSTLERALFEP